jgi:hypothetical protein
MKQMALAYSMKFVGKWMIDRFKEIEGETTGQVTHFSLPQLSTIERSMI